MEVDTRAAVGCSWEMVRTWYSSRSAVKIFTGSRREAVEIFRNGRSKVAEVAAACWCPGLCLKSGSDQ